MCVYSVEISPHEMMRKVCLFKPDPFLPVNIFLEVLIIVLVLFCHGVRCSVSVCCWMFSRLHFGTKLERALLCTGCVHACAEKLLHTQNLIQL